MQCLKKFPRLLVLSAVFLFLPNLPGAESADLSQNPLKDFKYEQLFKSLNISEPSTDFVAFSDFEKDTDKADHNASLEYLTSRPDLIERIREDLDSKEVHWQLEGLTCRLLYVPEDRKDVSGLFADYCRDTIEDLLGRTGLVNPYNSISVLNGQKNAVIESGEQGVNAVIVQDLAREYIAHYQFSGDSTKRVELGLTGQTKINEVGSYSSYLQYSEKIGAWQFFRNQQTVWKSASANPYTVLMTPLEETLHISLRKYTEKAILTTINAKQKTPSLKEVQDVVEDWLAVEEGIVGGLVYSLVPDVVLGRIPDLPREWIQADLESKAGFHKYRFLPQAIKMVQNYGLKKSIHSYAQDPVAIRNMLTQPI